MTEVNVIFLYEGKNIEIQAKREQNMKDIFSSLNNKVSKEVNNIIFLYNGQIINKNLRLEQINNKDNKITILVQELVDEDTQEEEDNLDQKNVLCPICGKSCIININDYKIALNKCENGHNKDNIFLKDYNEIQNSIKSKILCDKCKTEKAKIYGHKLFACCNCNTNLCPICKSAHDKSHIIIDYDSKDCTCFIHGERYTSYCQDCNKNLCDICELEHNKNHKFIYHREISPNPEIKNNLDKLKKTIDDYKKEAQSLVKIINKTIDLFDIYYKLSNDIINSYQKKNRNYQILMNLNNIDVANNNIIKDLLEIIEENDIEKKFKYIKIIHDKMEINKFDNISNIIYYTENINNLKNIYDDSDYFENNILGAFILCTNLESLKLVREDIIIDNRKDKDILFDLILGDFDLKKFQKFLNENKEFEKCIQNTFIYNKNLKNNSILNIESLKILGIYEKREDIKKAIYKFSSEDIKSFPLPRLIKYQDYLDKYKIFHKKISQFYGDLSPKTYKKYFEKLKIIIEQEEKENKLRNKNKDSLIGGFSTYEIKENMEINDRLIVREFEEETIYYDFNRWLYNLNIDNFEPVAYFTSRFMYSLNTYAKQNNYYCVVNNKKLYRGEKRPYSCLIPYERAKGKIISFSSFVSGSEDEHVAMSFAGIHNSKEVYKENHKFCIEFIIINRFKQNYISNGINIQNDSPYKQEKSFVFQPFSFYYVKDVQIDTQNYTSTIYLETIGREEILEEQIKKGKEIEFNEETKIMEVKK